MTSALRKQSGWTTTDGIPVAVRRSARRTASIIVQDAAARLLVPKWTTDAEIRDMLAKRARWIADKVAAQAARHAAIGRPFADGDPVRCLDRVFHLRLDDGLPFPAGAEEDMLRVSLRPNLAPAERDAAIRLQLRTWYWHLAVAHLADRTAHFAARLAVHPSRVAVKDYRRRWGSCSARGEIGYNWRLMMAPAHVADYVCAHEVAHIRHHDHSPAFWRAVAEAFPDHVEARTWLRTHGATLDL